MGQFDLFGGGRWRDADDRTSVFTIKVPEEEWDAKHKLALEREMLGLYVSGHPLNGVEHLLGRPGRHRRSRPSWTAMSPTAPRSGSAASSPR